MGLGSLEITLGSIGVVLEVLESLRMSQSSIDDGSVGDGYEVRAK